VEAPRVVVDVGCGMGANIHYWAQRYPESTFIGVDINQGLIDGGNTLLREAGLSNARLVQGDWFDLDLGLDQPADVVVSLQTLSWLPSYEEALKALADLGSPWLGISSLFHPGPVSCTIDVQEYEEGLAEGRRSFYNVYSLPLVEQALSGFGFNRVESSAFEIDVDLPRPEHGGLGTYTEKTERGARLQFSGPLHMPWHFIAAERPSIP